MEEVTTEQLHERFNSLSSLEKLDIMYDTIDYMKVSGIQNRLHSIATVMGYKIIENE
jgi:hypothetical protein